MCYQRVIGGVRGAFRARCLRRMESKKPSDQFGSPESGREVAVPTGPESRTGVAASQTLLFECPNLS